MPRKARATLDHRWILGIFVGWSSNSNESFIALANGNVIKSRSVARVVESHRWDAEAVARIRGTPGELCPTGRETIDPSIEESFTPHLDADAEDRAAAEDDQPMEGKNQRKEVFHPRMKITATDLRRFGFTDGCRRCADLMNNVARSRKHHSDECRLRIYLSWKEIGDPRYERVKHLIEPEDEKPDVDGDGVKDLNFSDRDFEKT